MFSEMLAELSCGRLPDAETLRRRFDMALTKKIAIVRMPAAYWVKDPKINPRSDHLFWASLVLLDRQRIDLAFAVLATEGAELESAVAATPEGMAEQARALVRCLLALIGDGEMRQVLRRDLSGIIPEWLDDAGSKDNRNIHGN